MDTDERTSALQAVLGCSKPSAAALAGAMVARNYPARTFIMHQGDRNSQLWLILSGTVQLQAVSIDGQATVISSFGPGELVGAFPDEDDIGYDARAFGPVAALQVEARDLRRLMDAHPDLGPGLAAIFSGQLDIVLDRLSARVTLSASGRVYRELLRLAGNSDNIAPPPVISALALTAQTTRETGSRAISALERRGIVERSEAQLAIRSRRLLEELVY
ncbi:Crp/Fnr family transcriptional regulator [Parerythrobacter aestuarii]|uniref:Crp/Fnr family transcriptional regulator n=1 Tax=Parerythrobacter aestuarii TaxID=3020909 RepID=UPI0024DE2864|nr:Crp/Fnr family transcriptional regulator [Parerythrobacter aestuarii]